MGVLVAAGGFPVHHETQALRGNAYDVTAKFPQDSDGRAIELDGAKLNRPLGFLFLDGPASEQGNELGAESGEGIAQVAGSAVIIGRQGRGGSKHVADGLLLSSHGATGLEHGDGCVEGGSGQQPACGTDGFTSVNAVVVEGTGTAVGDGQAVVLARGDRRDGREAARDAALAPVAAILATPGDDPACRSSLGGAGRKEQHGRAEDAHEAEPAHEAIVGLRAAAYKSRPRAMP